jgi:molybdenum cofactor biosynthesis enzyme MoaA
MAQRMGLDTPMLELSVTGKPYYNTLYPHFPAGGEMPASLALDIASAAAEAGFKRLVFTGTEPLRHLEILDICFGAGRCREFLEMGVSTQGAELRNMAAALKGAGVNLLEIRLETLQKVKSEFISGCSFADVRRGIQQAERTGFLIRMMTRLMGGVNDDELYDFCDLVKRHCFEQWFIELPKEEERHVSADAVLAARRNLEELEPREGVRRFRVDRDAGVLCLAAWADMDRLRVSADGVLTAHGAETDLSALDGERLTAALRGALNGGGRYSIEAIEE